MDEKDLPHTIEEKIPDADDIAEVKNPNARKAPKHKELEEALFMSLEQECEEIDLMVKNCIHNRQEAENKKSLKEGYPKQLPNPIFDLFEICMGYKKDKSYKDKNDVLIYNSDLRLIERRIHKLIERYKKKGVDAIINAFLLKIGSYDPDKDIPEEEKKEIIPREGLTKKELWQDGILEQKTILN